MGHQKDPLCAPIVHITTGNKRWLWNRRCSEVEIRGWVGERAAVDGQSRYAGSSPVTTSSGGCGWARLHIPPGSRHWNCGQSFSPISETFSDAHGAMVFALKLSDV
jgi:hypothetical protein